MDAYIPFEGSSLHVHMKLLIADITTEDTQSVEVFRKPDGIAEGDSLRVLQVAGNGIEAEYQTAKAQGGRYVTKGVVLTGAGNLTYPEHILHLHVDEENLIRFKETIVTALRFADKEELKSVAFPSLSRVTAVFESIMEFIAQYRPVCLHLIQLIFANDGGLTEAQLAIGFEKYKHLMKVECKNVRRCDPQTTALKQLLR